ncbi:MAG: hypothetical protein QXJ56_05375 [Ignisphaera sp.]
MSLEFKTISKLINHLNRETADKINSLNDEEKKVLEYFLQNVSVGAIIAVRELKAFYRVEDPKAVIRRLIDIGLLEQGYGCYNLSKTIREELLRLLLQQMRHNKGGI